MSELEQQLNMDNDNLSNYIIAYSQIPTALINKESKDSSNVQFEMNEIIKMYSIYKNGANFVPEGSKGDYVPSELKYKLARKLINKECRFLFAKSPDIKIDDKGNKEKSNDTNVLIYQDLIDTVLNNNNFGDKLLKASKDCAIGRRIALMVNFSEETGIDVTFLKSTSFIYERDFKTGNLSKFVGFTTLQSSISSAERRLFVKKYYIGENGKVYLTEEILDGGGNLIESIVEDMEIELGFIPVYIILNDGLLDDIQGISDMEQISSFETSYSKIANADIDAERKSMNPIRYTVDMDSESTKNLSSSAGSYWDLLTDQNIDRPSSQVGVLAPSMNHSEPLDMTLKRIKTAMYDELDMPDISTDSLQGMITSGKSLKAIFWNLVVRCEEKMKQYEPALKFMVDTIILGAKIYPDSISSYNIDSLPDTPYEVNIEQNFPLPEDEAEEKAVDMAEVATNVMSKKAYMMKWRNLTSIEADEEIKQMAIEREILENSFMPSSSDSPIDNQDDNLDMIQ